MHATATPTTIPAGKQMAGSSGRHVKVKSVYCADESNLIKAREAGAPSLLQCGQWRRMQKLMQHLGVPDVAMHEHMKKTRKECTSTLLQWNVLILFQQEASLVMVLSLGQQDLHSGPFPIAQNQTLIPTVLTEHGQEVSARSWGAPAIAPPASP